MNFPPTGAKPVLRATVSATDTAMAVAARPGAIARAATAHALTARGAGCAGPEKGSLRVGTAWCQRHDRRDQERRSHTGEFLQHLATAFHDWSLLSRFVFEQPGLRQLVERQSQELGARSDRLLSVQLRFDGVLMRLFRAAQKQSRLCRPGGGSGHPACRRP